MSDPELYEIARDRIDRRNRRWKLWTINLTGLIVVIASFILFMELVSSETFQMFGVFFLLIYIAQFVFHTINLGMAESRDGDIEKEIVKLRDAVYEKPKRLELSDDGELVELETADYDQPRQHLNQ